MNNFTGLNEKNLIEIQKILMNILKTKKEYSVFVFGSRSKNTYKPYSDLDLWLHSEPAMTSKELSVLRESFEESNIPIQVDLVTPENCLPEYKNQILSEKKLWFKGA